VEDKNMEPLMPTRQTSSVSFPSPVGHPARAHQVPHSGESNEMSWNGFTELRSAFEQHQREIATMIGAITRQFDSRFTSIEEAIFGNLGILQELSSNVAHISHWTKTTHGPCTSHVSHASFMSPADPAGKPLGKSQTSEILPLLDMIKQTQQEVSKLATEFSSERELWRKSVSVSEEKTPSSSPHKSNLGMLHSQFMLQTSRDKKTRSLGEEGSEDIFSALENFNVRTPQVLSTHTAQVEARDELETRINQICAQAQSVNDFYNQVTEGMHSAPVPTELGSCADMHMLSHNQIPRVNPPQIGPEKNRGATS